MNLQELSPAPTFFSVWDGTVLPFLFDLSPYRDHGHDGNLGQLEGYRTRVTHDTGPALDQLQLQAIQRPVGHGLGQLDAAQEGGQVLGQRVKLQPHLLVAELPA